MQLTYQIFISQSRTNNFCFIFAVQRAANHAVIIVGMMGVLVLCAVVLALICQSQSLEIKNSFHEVRR